MRSECWMQEKFCGWKSFWMEKLCPKSLCFNVEYRYGWSRTVILILAQTSKKLKLLILIYWIGNLNFPSFFNDSLYETTKKINISRFFSFLLVLNCFLVEKHIKTSFSRLLNARRVWRELKSNKSSKVLKSRISFARCLVIAILIALKS